MTIKFYMESTPYFEFSNFYKCHTVIEGIEYQTIEHYFQSKKFKNDDYCEQVAAAKNPMEAKYLGQSRKHELIDDWDDIKFYVMLNGLMYKFRRRDLRNILLETGDAEIIEDSPSDYIWGCGFHGDGLNLLGKAIMSVRQIYANRIEANLPV